MEKKVEKLKNQIKDATKQLEEIQTSCKHEKEKLKMTKSNDIRWVCENCEKITKFPTPTEIIDFLS